MTIRFISIPEATETTENPPTVTQFYRAIGSNNEAEVRLQAQLGTALAVSTINGTLFRQDILIRKTAHLQFDVVVNYGSKAGDKSMNNPNGLQVGEWTWEFDTTGYTATRRQSLETVGRYQAPNDPAASQPDATVPSQNGAINIVNGEVKGVDIIVPGMSLVITHRTPAGTVTLPFASQLMRVTPRVNSLPFLGFAAGEILYKGSRGVDGTQTDAVVVHFFEVSPNVIGLTFGDPQQPDKQVKNILKRGHDYIWVKYEEQMVDGPYNPSVPGDFVQVPVMAPKYVYVERVYDYADLASFLGFG